MSLRSQNSDFSAKISEKESELVSVKGEMESRLEEMEVIIYYYYYYFFFFFFLCNVD